MAVRFERELERKLQRLPQGERGPRKELITGLAEFVATVESSEPLGRLADALEHLPKVGEEGVSRETALEAARMRNLVRVLRDRARLKEESLKAGEVEKLLGVKRERLRHMRDKGEILGVGRGERRPTWYPHWQFATDGTILEGLRDVISAARDVRMGPEALHFFMTEPDERIGGKPPVDLLRRDESERIVELLLSAGLGSPVSTTGGAELAPAT
jgi:hypothetical protein